MLCGRAGLWTACWCDRVVGNLPAATCCLCLLQADVTHPMGGEDMPSIAAVRPAGCLWICWRHWCSPAELACCTERRWARATALPSIRRTLFPALQTIHLQVVGSMDASATRYAARVSMQSGRQEIVANLKDVRLGGRVV